MSRNRSIFISRFLDDLGYSKEMVKLRQRCYKSSPNEERLLCGSKREGLTLPFENDFDSVMIDSLIECRDVVHGYSRNDVQIKFQLERHHNTAPGYTLLKCISLNNCALSERVRDCLVEVDEGTYLLSSDSWRQGYKDLYIDIFSSPGNDGIITHSHDNQGPSSPSEVLGLSNWDEVNAIVCHCPRVLSYWRNRQRLYDWPSSELIDTVSSLEAHVVPIGYKESPLHFLEWRICFTKAEIRLIESLNDCQIKLIIILKMLAKHELKAVCKEMSSYVMKNLVLWMAEKYQSKAFVEDRLLVLLKHSLKLLKLCIQNKELPSYMIEERNLFADRISDIEGRELCRRLDMLLHEGANMLLRCPKIVDGLNLFRISPDQYYLLSERRRCVETLQLHFNLIDITTVADHLFNNGGRVTFQDLFMSVSSILLQDGFYLQVLCSIIDIVLPDHLDVFLRGDNLLNVILERFRLYMS